MYECDQEVVEVTLMSSGGRASLSGLFTFLESAHLRCLFT